jgi:hypothetical protein
MYLYILSTYWYVLVCTKCSWKVERRPFGTLPDFDIEGMDFDIEAWTPLYVFTYIGVPNFDIEALYFDFDIGPDIGLRYRMY